MICVTDRIFSEKPFNCFCVLWELNFRNSSGDFERSRVWILGKQRFLLDSYNYKMVSPCKQIIAFIYNYFVNKRFISRGPTVQV